MDKWMLFDRQMTEDLKNFFQMQRKIHLLTLDRKTNVKSVFIRLEI